MDIIKITYYKSTLGELIIGSFKDKICLCDWRYRKMRAQIDNRIGKGLNAGFTEESSPIIRQCIQQLEEYFNGKRTNFDLPLKLVGTPFQQQVWNMLLTIPYGQTSSYLKLSQKLNNVTAIRAVASANGANAISIIVPCHRIIGSDGKLVGYAGGIKAKKMLLQLESKEQLSFQLNLFKN
ncbi:methylated-DNA--[protein]-cysteine S-methyltransferase [Labilibacter sediminis]|nr:methylated-DNA--[protein]-cysteine S-methyltransferase [Labilibacter sediminis]